MPLYQVSIVQMDLKSVKMVKGILLRIKGHWMEEQAFRSKASSKIILCPSP